MRAEEPENSLNIYLNIYHFLTLDNGLKFDTDYPIRNYSEDEILFQIEHITYNKNQSLTKKP